MARAAAFFWCTRAPRRALPYTMQENTYGNLAVIIGYKYPIRSSSQPVECAVTRGHTLQGCDSEAKPVALIIGYISILFASSPDESDPVNNVDGCCTIQSGVGGEAFSKNHLVSHFGDGFGIYTKTTKPSGRQWDQSNQAFQEKYNVKEINRSRLTSR